MKNNRGSELQRIQIRFEPQYLCNSKPLNLKKNYTFLLPVISEMINNTKKIKNKTFAILAAPAAIPPKPNIPAIIARIIKMTV